MHAEAVAKLAGSADAGVECRLSFKKPMISALFSSDLLYIGWLHNCPLHVRLALAER